MINRHNRYVLNSIYDKDGNKVYVRVKYDDGKPSSQFWDEATNLKAAFAKKPGKTLKELIGSKTFMFEYTPFQSGRTMVTFNLADLKDKMEPFTDACGLK